MIMSFLGSIGNFMKGSGIEGLFIEVHAEITVNHTMSRKAFSRALHIHFLTEGVLVTLLLEKIFDSHAIEAKVFKEQLTEDFKNSDIANKEVLLEAELCRYESGKQEELKVTLFQEFRRVKLWLLYIYYLNVLKRFIIAERTSNWSLHIDSTLRMLNLFSLSGHIKYANSGRIYIQQMQSLVEEYPCLYEKFVAGFHAVRRSNHHWSDLWSNLVIEQTLLGSIKINGGFTRGRSVSESVRHMWTLSFNQTSSVHCAMMDLTDMVLKTNNQYVDVTDLMQKQDYENLKALLKEGNTLSLLILICIHFHQV